MLLDQASRQLGWPDRRQVIKPSVEEMRFGRTGPGEDRLPLERAGASVEVGVLSSAPEAANTDAPLAIVCEFSRRPRSIVGFSHKLAWNFCRTRLLITAERDRLRAWTCCKPPTADIQAKFVLMTSFRVGGQAESSFSLPDSGQCTPLGEPYFRGVFPLTETIRPEDRADALLLANLRFVRTALLDANLPKDVCHDLLARLIFVQFLFHRKDKQGNPFLDDTLMQGRLQGRAVASS